MSLSVIPLTILGQITGVTGSGETALYQVSFKSIDGMPLYGVTAVWTDEQAEIEALAAQKSYGVWINPVDGEFTIKFAGYTYIGSADLTDSDVLAGITPIEFNNEAAGGGSEEMTKVTGYIYTSGFDNDDTVIISELRHIESDPRVPGYSDVYQFVPIYLPGEFDTLVAGSRFEFYVATQARQHVRGTWSIDEENTKNVTLETIEVEPGYSVQYFVIQPGDEHLLHATFTKAS